MGISTLLSAQSNQVVNAYNAIRNKEYDKGKIAADAAAVHPSTSNSAKMWMYRGKIYQGIYESKNEEVRKLDNEAQEKSVESYITCLKNDKDNIYKDEVKDLLVQTCAALQHKTKYYMQIKDFDKANKGLELLEMALSYDFDQGLKHNNITKENLMYSRFKTYGMAGNKEKTKEFGDKLIESKYKDPSIYKDMVKISLLDKDTAKALTYIEKGKLIFEDNIDLINQEIKIYVAQKKTDVLKKNYLMPLIFHLIMRSYILL